MQVIDVLILYCTCLHSFILILGALYTQSNSMQYFKLLMLLRLFSPLSFFKLPSLKAGSLPFLPVFSYTHCRGLLYHHFVRLEQNLAHVMPSLNSRMKCCGSVSLEASKCFPSTKMSIFPLLFCHPLYPKGQFAGVHCISPLQVTQMR